MVEGRVPEDLVGTLYRNGPGQLVRGGVRTGHWFDGDGAVLAVRFGGGGATATYQYVETEGGERRRRRDGGCMAITGCWRRGIGGSG